METMSGDPWELDLRGDYILGQQERLGSLTDSERKRERELSLRLRTAATDVAGYLRENEAKIVAERVDNMAFVVAIGTTASRVQSILERNGVCHVLTPDERREVKAESRAEEQREEASPTKGTGR